MRKPKELKLLNYNGCVSYIMCYKFNRKKVCDITSGRFSGIEQVRCIAAKLNQIADWMEIQKMTQNEKTGDNCNRNCWSSIGGKVCSCRQWQPIPPATPKPEPAKEPEVCAWKTSEEEVWSTACGHDFYFSAGRPIEDGIIFCPYCGKKIEVIK